MTSVTRARPVRPANRTAAGTRHDVEVAVSRDSPPFASGTLPEPKSLCREAVSTLPCGGPRKHRKTAPESGITLLAYRMLELRRMTCGFDRYGHRPKPGFAPPTRGCQR